MVFTHHVMVFTHHAPSMYGYLETLKYMEIDNIATFESLRWLKFMTVCGWLHFILGTSKTLILAMIKVSRIKSNFIGRGPLMYHEYSQELY